jgi:Gluconate 2-dehydrogenase subunit 3
MGDSYRALIRSSRVSTGTREALEARAKPDDPLYVPRILDPASIATLRALLDRIVPQTPPRDIDLAARIDQQLSLGAGDGWRPASLPADSDACRAGLRTLDHRAMTRHGVRYTDLDPSRQDAMLVEIIERSDASDTPGDDPEGLDPEQLRAWFEELRVDAVRLFIATPRSLSRVGYSGIANGGDGMPKSGFVRVGLGEREDWEPLPCADGDL